MNIYELQKTWDTLGQEDAFWAVLTDTSKQGKKWEQKEFFATGVNEIKEVIEEIRTLQKPLKTKKALDFGCGVGRLTQALAYHFDEVIGVDIAPSMIEQAKKLGKRKKNCSFLLNSKSNLSLFPDKSFNLIYSNITLQHMKPKYAKAYLKEFLRIISPKGLIIFQLPSTPAKTFKGMLIRILPFFILTKLRKNIEMYAIKREEVETYLKKNKAKVVKVNNNNNAGSGWISYTYFVIPRS